MSKFVVTGCQGQLGSELCLLLGSEAVGLQRPDFDLREREDVAENLRRLRPAYVINTAAYTDVDRAEQEAEACFHINATAVENLASVCREMDCVLVQLSTDYVFGANGARDVPYDESDPTGPLSVYGRSKCAAEEIARAWHKHIVVRTAGLYAPARTSPRPERNFVDNMLALASTNDRLSVVADQICSTTFAPDLARAIVYLVSTDRYGTYHIVNPGATSRLDFTREIFQQAGIDVRLQPITSEQYGAAAPRPKYSVLSTQKYDATGGPVMPSWTEALAAYFRMSDPSVKC